MTEPTALMQHWLLDPGVVFLNHGSFGATPKPVLERQNELRRKLEAEPVRFFLREYPDLLHEARVAVAAFVNADPEGLVFVPNATSAVNAVLRSLALRPGDEVLSTSHGYPACRFAAGEIAQAAGAVAVEATLPLPVMGPDQVVDAVVERMTSRTRVLVVDHVSSPTALVLPLAPILREARARGIPVLVDGAHAPGMLDLDLTALGADFYTGNCHKWMCSPKGAGFLWVAEHHRGCVRPAVLSHAAGAGPRPGRFREEFDWTGTIDPTAALCVPEAIRFMADLVPGAWPEIRRRNNELVRVGRRELAALPGIEPVCPESMLGSMATVILPPAAPDIQPETFGWDPLQGRLYDDFAIEVPVVAFPQWPRRVLRISAQLYNHENQYRRLADALTQLMGC